MMDSNEAQNSLEQKIKSLKAVVEVKDAEIKSVQQQADERVQAIEIDLEETLTDALK